MELDLVTPLVVWLNANALVVWATAWMFVGAGVAGVAFARDPPSSPAGPGEDGWGCVVVVVFIVLAAVWPAVVAYWVVKLVAGPRDR